MLSYVHHHRAWWHETNLPALHAEGLVDDVMFGEHDPDAGIVIELRMVWHEPERHSPAAQLRCFHDAWPLLPALAGLFDRLAHLPERQRRQLTPTQFCALLDEQGFTDRTPTEPPDDHTGPGGDMSGASP